MKTDMTRTESLLPVRRMAASNVHPVLFHTPLRHIFAAILLLIASMLPRIALAAPAGCTFGSGTTEVVQFSPPSVISIAYNTPVNTVIYSSGQIAPSGNAVQDCYNTYTYGIRNVVGTQPPASTRIFPTNVPGLSYSITHGDNSTYLYPYGCCIYNDGNRGASYNLSVTSSLVLIKTGSIVSGSTLNAGTLGYWFFDTNMRAENFNLGNSVTIIDPACSVNTTPVNVTLPTVSTQSMTAVGATGGTTPFAISLTCASGANLDIQLDFAGAASGIAGVLAKGSGTSAGVGVQLLDKNLVPVTFGSAGKTLVGATPDGPLSIKYYARYYRTAAMTPGTLTASATFTVSYE